MVKTAWLLPRIIKYLADGPRSIHAIRDHINATTCHGTSMGQLVNILGKGKSFKVVGLDTRGSYKTQVWALAAEA